MIRDDERWTSVIDLTTEITDEFLNGLWEHSSLPSFATPSLFAAEDDDPRCFIIDRLTPPECLADSHSPRDVYAYLQMLDSAQKRGFWTKSFEGISETNASAAAGMTFLRKRCGEGKAFVAQTTLDHSFLHPQPKNIWNTCYHLVLACVHPEDLKDAVTESWETNYRWETPRWVYPPLIITNIRAPPPPHWDDENFAAIDAGDLCQIAGFMYRDIAHPAAHLPYLTTFTATSIQHYRDQFFYIEGLDLISPLVIERYFARRPPVRVPPPRSRLARRFTSPKTVERTSDLEWDFDDPDRPWTESEPPRKSFFSGLFNGKKVRSTVPRTAEHE